MADEQSAPTSLGDNAQATVRGYADRAIRLEGEITDAIAEHVKPLRDALKELYDEADGSGFDKKALKEAIRRFKLDETFRGEVETLEAALLKDLLS